MLLPYSVRNPRCYASGRALLKRMAPEHKFATSARLCSEVLAAYTEGTLPLAAAGEVLRDALHILACRDIRVLQLARAFWKKGKKGPRMPSTACLMPIRSVMCHDGTSTCRPAWQAVLWS